MKTQIEAYAAERAGKDVGQIFGAVAAAAREIEHKIRLAGLTDIYGAQGTENVQGEQQQKLDVFANDELIAMLGTVPSVAAIISEEDDAPVLFHKQGKVPESAEYVVIFDPLDGSSNIDVNVNVGTIFSIAQLAGDVVASVLVPGTEQVAAGYVVYGPSTVMVVALSNRPGVACFTLDDDGHFVLTAEGMTMPEQGPYYSANEANAASWPAEYRGWVAEMVEGRLGVKHGARYIGSLVADFHRTLLKGGVFLYPPTAKAPRGKLRLLYEARPLALIAEQADGAAVNGAERILEVRAEGIHDRTALVIGSRLEVDALQSRVRAEAAR